MNAVEDFMEEYIEMDKGYQEGGVEGVSDDTDSSDVS